MRGHLEPIGDDRNAGNSKAPELIGIPHNPIVERDGLCSGIMSINDLAYSRDNCLRPTNPLQNLAR